MKLHTSLAGAEVWAALGRARASGRIAYDVRFAVWEPGSSQTHVYSYEIQLGADDQHSLPAGYTDQNGRTMRVRRTRGGSQGEARYAATWHEWGWLIAEIFAADPGSRWGTNPARSRHPDRAWGYFSPADFHAKTDGQFKEETTMPIPADDHDARTTAPPVPGVTQNLGYTVLGVLPGEAPGMWYVYATNAYGHAVTWRAEQTGDGYLAYFHGRYFDSRDRAQNQVAALASLAERVGITWPEATPAARASFGDSRTVAMQELVTGGVARPRVRDALTEAAALGRAEVRLASGSTRVIRYDRARGEFQITAN